MRKRRVLVKYSLLFVAMFAFVAFQIAQSGHFLGYVTFAPSEEQSITSVNSDFTLSFEEPLVLSKGTGKNTGLHFVYRGQAPLFSCSVSSESPSDLFVSSSSLTFRPGEEGVFPVNIQTSSHFYSDARNLTLLFSCEGYRVLFTFPFTLADEPVSAPVLTGLAIQDETKSKISWVTWVFIAVVVVLIVAHFFHRHERRIHESSPRPRRKLIPLDLSS